MQVNVHPIAYSGISEDLLEQFLATSSLPLFCTEPTYIGSASSQTYSIPGISTKFDEDTFLVVDGEDYSLGFYNYPWALRIKLKDISTDFNFKHWGTPLSSFLDVAITDTRIMDFRVRNFGDRSFLLCMVYGIPIVIVFDRITSLLSFNAQRYYLFSTQVDHMQWIEMPNGTNKILLRKGDNLYFVSIPNVPGAYPILEAPINVANVVNRGRENRLAKTSWIKQEFYYHGNTLCFYSAAGNSDTKFYHWDSTLRSFVLDLTLSLSSYYMYYSTYNGAVNILYEDKTFIGDYKWYLITPASDLYTYFYYPSVSLPYDHEDYPWGDSSGTYPIPVHQDAQYVYFVFIDRLQYALRLYYIKYEQPTVTTALFNINTGKPFSAITGYLSIDGDLFYPDFKWEVASKRSFNTYTGQPELNITEPSIVNLRLTPSMPQAIYAINHTPIADTLITYEHVDERLTNFTIPYVLIRDYNKIDISLYEINTSPFMLIAIDNLNIRHCYNNAGTFCLASREEYKTANCNSNCPQYLKKNLIKDIELNGTDIVGSITDEREIFPDYQENAVLDVRLYK